MYRLRVLGGISLDGPEGPLEGRVSQRRPLALLSLLALAPGGALSRDKAVAFLWPDHEAERARHLLSVTLHAIRKSLGAESVRSVGDDLRLDPAVVTSDAREFEAAVEAAEWERAVERYGGPFLDGFHVSGAPEFERWVDEERGRFARRYGEALEVVARAAEAAGDRKAALVWWKKLAAHDPCSSRVALRLMEALDAAGDRPAALRHARAHGARVREQLGVDPDPEVEALVERLEAGEVLRPQASRPDLSEASPGEPQVSDGDTSRGPSDIRAASSAGKIPPRDGAEGRRRPPWKSPKMAVVVLCLMLVGLALWAVSGDESPGGLGQSDHQVAVLPFQFRGTGGSTDLGRGVPELLARALDGAGELRAIRTEEVFRLAAMGPTPDSPAVRVILAEQAGAGLCVEGSVVEVGGDGLRVSVAVRDASREGAVIARATVDGNEEELPRLVDRLAIEILEQFYGRRAADQLRHVAARTTDSLSALKAVLTADRVSRGPAQPMLEPLTRAVAIDSGYAVAHYYLAVAASRAWRPELARRSIERALRFGDRFTQRELELAKAFRDYLVGDADQAEQRYRSLLRKTVLDLEAWVMLGKTLLLYNPFRGRSVREAREPFERALSIDSTEYRATVGLASLVAGEGRWTVWDSLSRRALGPRYESWRKSSNRAIYFLDSREELEARIRRIEGYPSELVNRNVNSFSTLPDLRPAGRVAGLLTEKERPDEWRALGHNRLAKLAFAAGRPSEAEAALAAAEALDARRALEGRLVLATLTHGSAGRAELEALREELVSWSGTDRRLADPHLAPPLHEGPIGPYLRPYFLGLLSAALGDDAEARRWAVALADMDGPPGLAALPRDLALGVRADLARRRGELEAALRALETMDLTVPRHDIYDSPFHTRLRERYLRGHVLRQLGRRAEALPWFEGVIFGGRRGLLYRAPALVRQGEILEDLGHHERAALAYRRAGILLTESEPEFRPLVDRVQSGQERLAAEERGGGSVSGDGS